MNPKLLLLLCEEIHVRTLNEPDSYQSIYFIILRLGIKSKSCLKTDQVRRRERFV